MSEIIICPDCGHRNPSGARSCEHCNFPLVPPAPADAEVPLGAAPVATAGPPPSQRVETEGQVGPSGEVSVAPAGEVPSTPAASEVSPPVVLRRPMRPRPRGSTQIVSMWLMFGVVAAMAMVWLAIKTNLDRQNAPIEGAKPDQQVRANEMRAILAKDSTDVAAHIGLADVLYDSGNWPEAIIHYRAAVTRDSSQTTALVDLGVCYYNLGQTAEAERHFMLALQREPNQPIALFNLGIVHERREDFDGALQYFHRAMQSSPPESMQPALMEAMQRLQQKTGKIPPPLPEGR